MLLKWWNRALCLFLHLYSYLGNNSTSNGLLWCKSKSWGGKCRSRVFSQHAFIQNLSILIYIFTGECFWGLGWSFQSEEETANSGSISLRLSLCTQICCLLCMILLSLQELLQERSVLCVCLWPESEHKRWNARSFHKMQFILSSCPGEKIDENVLWH